MHVWLTCYRPSQQPCTGNPCTQHSDDAQRYRVRADHINVGTATVLLRRTDTGPGEKVWHRQVAQNPDAPGGLLVFASGMLRCSGDPERATSRCATRCRCSWSARVSVRTGCATL